MRKIEKQPDAPECLSGFVEIQLQSGPPVVNLWYRSFQKPRKPEFLKILTDEQFGLCGYTGAPVDERIGDLTLGETGIKISNHIEHLKCQEQCRKELEEQGMVYGCDLGDDLSYFNMIAALEIRGAEDEQFGAVFKDNNHLPVWPTHDGCEARFRFRESDGGVEGLDAEAITSVDVLRLNHDTLMGWRRAAIDTFLDPAVVISREDFEAVLAAVETPRVGDSQSFRFLSLQ